MLPACVYFTVLIDVQIKATPLHEACFNDFREAVPILIEAGADINAKNVVSRYKMHFL